MFPNYARQNMGDDTAVPQQGASSPSGAPNTPNVQSTSSAIGGYLVYILIAVVIILLIVIGYLLYSSSSPPKPNVAQHGPHPGGQQPRRMPPAKPKKMPDVEAPEDHQSNAQTEDWAEARNRQKQRVELSRSLARQKAAVEATVEEIDDTEDADNEEHEGRHVANGQSEFVQE